jgi:hypothetical protein
MLPGFDAVRAVTRIVVVTIFPVSVLLGLMLDRLMASPHGRRRIAAMAIAVLLVAEAALVAPSHSSKAEWRRPETALIRQLPARLPPDAVLAVRTPEFGYWVRDELTVELVALSRGLRAVNGYSGNAPPGWRRPLTCGDVGGDLRGGRHFRDEHGLPAPAIAPGQLVLIGYGDCDRAALLRDPVLTLGETYRFGMGQAGEGFLGGDFSSPEAWGRWTEGQSAHLYFSLASPPPKAVIVAIDAASFSAGTDGRQTADIDANGQPCGSVSLWAGHSAAQAICPAGALRQGNNVVRFRIRHPARPADTHVNADTRLLGIGLRSLTLRNVD